MRFSYRDIWKMSYPILLSMLMQQLVGITDIIYLGRLSEVDLGASALGSTYFFTVFMVAFGFSVGAQIIMARRNGEQQYRQIGEVFYQGCAFLIVTAALIVILSYFLTPHLLNVLIDNAAIREATRQYIDWRMLGLFAASILVMGRAFFVAVTSTFVLTLISLVMVLANVILNYILIFGKFGMPALGIAGAAIASDTAELIAIAVAVIYFIIKVDTKKFGLNRFIYKNFRLLKSILDVSVWTMLQQFVSVSTWFLFFVAIEHLGERELAVSNLLRSLSSFPFVVVNAMAAAISSMTSNLIGQGDKDEVWPACMRGMKLCSLVILPMLIIMAIFPEVLLRLYTDNIQLIKASLAPYNIMLLSFVTFVPAWILFNAVSGTGNTKYAMVIEFAAMLVYVLHITVVILYFKMPLSVCWTADWVYNIVVLALSYKYMASRKWYDKVV